MCMSPLSAAAERGLGGEVELLSERMWVMGCCFIRFCTHFTVSWGDRKLRTIAETDGVIVLIVTNFDNN